MQVEIVIQLDGITCMYCTILLCSSWFGITCILRKHHARESMWNMICYLKNIMKHVIPEKRAIF